MIAKCVVCGKEFEKRDKVGTERRVKNIRKSNCLTCSKGCSKQWTRIKIREYSRRLNEKKHSKRKDEKK